tara:strand:+ start:248 stop:517 length:270 start_codon:yes stop_codon:yes gene_type:complete
MAFKMKFSGFKNKDENPDYAFRSLYDEGSHYGRHQGKENSKELNYVPQSKQPKFQDEINEEYLQKKRNLDYDPQSQVKQSQYIIELKNK